MAHTHQRSVRRWSVPIRSVLLLAAVGVLVVAIIIVLGNVGDRDTVVSSTRGSGVSATEHRDVAPFATVELAGSNTVVVHAGAPLSVEVSGDDNLVGRVTTVVRRGHLVVDDVGSFTTKAPMRVVVSTPSLDGVILGGAGTVTVDGAMGADFDAELAGDGTLAVAGMVRRVTALLAGAGTLDLHNLVATDGTARLEGAGTIRVHATATLDAELTGTGTILYSGAPAVTVHHTGTGTVAPE